jgi:2-C-methyl-D-erythritol 4-phosphate cytidylyltransferase
MTEGSSDDPPFADAIILAAGSSTRMGRDKLLMEVGGIPLVGWTVRAAVGAESVRRIIIVARADRIEAVRHELWHRDMPVTVVVGGPRRQDSVAAGVEAADGEILLIHDGARPLLTSGLFDRVAFAARANGAAVPVVPVPESMRRMTHGRIVSILDRTDLYRSQTPHGIQRRVLMEVYKSHDPRGPKTFIDETTLVQSAGVVVSTVPGEPANLKVTLPGDEELAFALLEARARGVQVGVTPS